MNKNRRLCVVAAAVALVAAPAFPQAASTSSGQGYPARPVRVIVPAQAGGGVDIVARAVAQKLAERWGQQVVVDNRIGIAGTETAARATPDGYTIVLTTAAIAVRQAVYRKLPYDVLRDFQPVTQVVMQSNVLVTTPSLPAASVKELVALAKARPGQLNYGSGGNATSNHLAGELFRILAGIDVVHVPYRGVPLALTDLVAGRVQFSFGSPVSTLPLVKEGKLRLLAVTTARRSPALPGVPTIAEAGVPGYEFTGWMGVLTPAGVPRGIVTKLYQDIAAAAQLPEVKQRFAADGADPVGSSPEEFAAYLRAEIARWTKVVKAAGIKAD
jgi:tripartite-type tricarboxylate transporter receptor subunit TctC